MDLNGRRTRSPGMKLCRKRPSTPIGNAKMWTEVSAAYDKVKTDPSKLVGSADVRAGLAALHERTVKESS